MAKIGAPLTTFFLVALVPAGALGLDIPVHPIGQENVDYNARPRGSSAPVPLLLQMLKTASSET